MQTQTTKKTGSGHLSKKKSVGLITRSFTSRNSQRPVIRNILNSSEVQTKLTIGAPNDIYEQEADRVANQVMSMSEPVQSLETVFDEKGLHRSSTTEKTIPYIQRLCAECDSELQRRAEPKKAEEDLVQTKREINQSQMISDDLQDGIQSLKGSGQPLPQSEREYFNQRFGADFGNVRIHTGHPAQQLARSISAQAFTVGQDILFGAGHYNPSTTPGRHLIAHELTHTIQQLGFEPRIVQRTSYSNCDPKQIKDLIEPAMNAALVDLRDVITALGASPRSDLTSASLFLAFRKEDDSTATKVKAVFEEIRDGLKRDTIYCDQPGNSGILPDILVPEAFRCVTSRLGYTNPLFNIHLCMNSWPTVGKVLRLQNLIHEGVHAYEKMIGDQGYFNYYTCAETASSEKINWRLGTPDCYSCFVHYMQHDTGIIARANTYRGSSLVLVQDPVGTIDLNSPNETTPMFRMIGVPPHSGFKLRWVIADGNDNRYLMRATSGNPFEYGDFQETFIGVPTRKLLKQRSINSAQVFCRVLMPEVGDQLIKIPVNFIL